MGEASILALGHALQERPALASGKPGTCRDRGRALLVTGAHGSNWGRPAMIASNSMRNSALTQICVGARPGYQKAARRWSAGSQAPSGEIGPKPSMLVQGFAANVLASRVVAWVVAQKLIEMHGFDSQAVGGGQVSFG